MILYRGQSHRVVFLLQPNRLEFWGIASNNPSPIIWTLRQNRKICENSNEFSRISFDTSSVESLQFSAARSAAPWLRLKFTATSLLIFPDSIADLGLILKALASHPSLPPRLLSSATTRLGSWRRKPGLSMVATLLGVNSLYGRELFSARYFVFAPAFGDPLLPAAAARQGLLASLAELCEGRARRGLSELGTLRAGELAEIKNCPIEVWPDRPRIELIESEEMKPVLTFWMAVIFLKGFGWPDLMYIELESNKIIRSPDQVEAFENFLGNLLFYRQAGVHEYFDILGDCQIPTNPQL